MRDKLISLYRVLFKTITISHNFLSFSYFRDVDRTCNTHFTELYNMIDKARLIADIPTEPPI